MSGETSSTTRLVSPRLSNAIAPGLPAYTHDQVKVAAPSDLGDVVQLPKMVVRAPRLPMFGERNLLSPDGFASLLRERYPGASLKGQDPEHSRIPNYAAMMYRDDNRLKQMNALDELADVLRRTGDLPGNKDLKAEIQRTFIRHEDWRTEGMDKSVNHWRR